MNKKGLFESNFDVEEGLYQLNDGKEATLLFLKGGFDLKLDLNTKDFDETIVYKGKGANENNFLAKNALLNEAFENELEALLNQDEPTFVAGLDKKSVEDEARINAAKLDQNFTKVFKENQKQEKLMLMQYYKQKAASKKLDNSLAPDFNYENHKGGTVKLSDLKGKYVYIDVWATWCGPCRAEIPHLKRVEEQFHGKKIEFISISVDVQKDYDKWKQFVTDKQLGGIQLFADKNWQSDFIKAFNINSIPRFILIDDTGKVVNADAPRPSSPQLVEILTTLVK